jgi:ABC transporter substrate binding protein
VIRSSGADPKLAAELIALNVEVMLAAATPAAKAAQSATTKIAIVMADPGDAVQLGLVASLARPGANITGVTSLAPELATKRLELLKEAFPKRARRGSLEFRHPARGSGVERAAGRRTRVGRRLALRGGARTARVR